MDLWETDMNEWDRIKQSGVGSYPVNSVALKTARGFQEEMVIRQALN